MDINELVQKCMPLLYASGYPPERARAYKEFWLDELKPYLDKECEGDYTPSVGELFVNQINKGCPRSVAAFRCLSCHILDTYIKTGKLPRYIHALPKYPLEGAIGEAAQRFLDDAIAVKRLRDLTVTRIRRDLNLFISLLSSKGKYKLSELEATDIADFLKGIVPNKNNRHYTIHQFLAFLKAENEIDEDFSSLTKYRRPDAERLMSVYTLDEVSAVEASVSRVSPVGKRDFVVILLASRLGLRSSDIATLRLSQIDWDNNEINIVQFKTGMPLQLPLLRDVGEAIIDYLKVRPKVHFENIFATVVAPYKPLTNVSINAIVRRAFANAGIAHGTRHKGPHALRHSFATSMLNNGVPLPIISASLGHTDTTTTMAYLRVSTVALNECTLDVPTVDDAFFEQKGGIFYE